MKIATFGAVIAVVHDDGYGCIMYPTSTIGASEAMKLAASLQEAASWLDLHCLEQDECKLPIALSRK